jgi:hypothetical protein
VRMKVKMNLKRNHQTISLLSIKIRTWVETEIPMSALLLSSCSSIGQARTSEMHGENMYSRKS